MTDAGKKALEELVAELRQGPNPDEAYTLDELADFVVKYTRERTKAAKAIATLEARATAAEERVKRLEATIKLAFDYPDEFRRAAQKGEKP